MGRKRNPPRRMHIRKGDHVVVIAGRDIDKRGKVLKLFPGKGQVLVEKINIVHKHQKPGRGRVQSGIQDVEAPIDVSNVMVVCGKCDQGVRVRKAELADGKRVRVCRRCGEVLDQV